MNRQEEKKILEEFGGQVSPKIVAIDLEGENFVVTYLVEAENQIYKVDIPITASKDEIRKAVKKHYWENAKRRMLENRLKILREGLVGEKVYIDLQEWANAP